MIDSQLRFCGGYIPMDGTSRRLDINCPVCTEDTILAPARTMIWYDERDMVWRLGCPRCGWQDLQGADPDEAVHKLCECWKTRVMLEVL